ncbi:hypothetical protein Anas_05965 [Armadillidium nasatum]|uniref:Uncharacterized protein n=1 Tax=Armadillidium nasatum TaxID=96803 RepID=A0A5N5TDU1_9CRUS|nr:hypothetical protein Anas_05965 [Armadillidium nasatum]
MMFGMSCKVFSFAIAWISLCIGVYIYYLNSGPGKYTVPRRELQRYQDLYFEALSSSYLNEILTYDDRVFLLLENFVLKLHFEDEAYNDEVIPATERGSVANKMISLSNYDNKSLTLYLNDQFFINV